MAKDYESLPLEESDAAPDVPPSRHSNKTGKTHRAGEKAYRNRESSRARDSPKSRNAGARPEDSYSDDGPKTQSSNDQGSSEDRRVSQMTREDSADYGKSLSDKRAKSRSKRQESPSRQKGKNSSRKSKDVRDKGRKKQFDLDSPETEGSKSGPKRDPPSYTNFVLQFGTRDSSSEGEPVVSLSSYGLPGLRMKSNRGTKAHRVSGPLGNDYLSADKCYRCGAGPETVGEIFQRLPACQYCLEEFALTREVTASARRPLVSFETFDGSGAGSLYSQSVTDSSEFGPAAPPNKVSHVASFHGPTYESDVIAAHCSFESVSEGMPDLQLPTSYQRRNSYSPPSQSAVMKPVLLVNTHVPYNRRDERGPGSSTIFGGPSGIQMSDVYGGVWPEQVDGQSCIFSEMKVRQTKHAPSLGQGTNARRNALLTRSRTPQRVHLGDRGPLQKQGTDPWDRTVDDDRRVRPFLKSNRGVQRALSSVEVIEHIPTDPSALDVTPVAPSFGRQFATEANDPSPDMIAYEAWQRYARDYRRFQQNLAEWELQHRQKLLEGRRPPAAAPSSKAPPPNDKQEDDPEKGEEEEEGMRIRIAVTPKSRRSRVQVNEATGRTSRAP